MVEECLVEIVDFTPQKYNLTAFELQFWVIFTPFKLISIIFAD
jgi:hypothetical protein